MAEVKGHKGTFTSYADKVYELMGDIPDKDAEEAMPLIQRLYEASIPHEEAAQRLTSFFNRRSTPPEVDVYMPNDNPDEKAPYYIELYKVGDKGVQSIENESLSHPRLRIVHDDGTETTIVGMPFVLRAKPEQDHEYDDILDAKPIKSPKL